MNTIYALVLIVYHYIKLYGWTLDEFWKLLEFISRQENKMDVGALNSLGYIEVIEISIWLGFMYYGKCWIDNKFKQEKYYEICFS